MNGAPFTVAASLVGGKPGQSTRSPPLAYASQPTVEMLLERTTKLYVHSLILNKRDIMTWRPYYNTKIVAITSSLFLTFDQIILIHKVSGEWS